MEKDKARKAMKAVEQEMKDDIKSEKER
jgi:hypothetical protein